MPSERFGSTPTTEWLNAWNCLNYSNRLRSTLSRESLSKVSAKRITKERKVKFKIRISELLETDVWFTSTNDCNFAWMLLCGSILDGESLSAFHSRRSLSQRTNNSRASGERDHRNLLAGRLKMWTNSLQHALRLVVVWLLIIVIIVFGVRRKRWCLTLHTFHCRQHGRVQRDDATIAVSGWYTWLSINWNTMRRLVWAIPCARSGASARQCGCLSQSRVTLLEWSECQVSIRIQSVGGFEIEFQVMQESELGNWMRHIAR